MDLNRNSTDYIDKHEFSTSPLDLIPQHSFAATEQILESKTQGPPTPDHKIFLPETPGETSETTACFSTAKDQLLGLSKEFQPGEKNKLEREKSTHHRLNKNKNQSN